MSSKYDAMCQGVDATDPEQVRALLVEVTGQWWAWFCTGPDGRWAMDISGTVYGRVIVSPSDAGTLRLYCSTWTTHDSLPALIEALAAAGLVPNVGTCADEPTVCTGCVKREAEIVALRACVAIGARMAAYSGTMNYDAACFKRAINRANAANVKGDE